jgi:hypothetical protein
MALFASLSGDLCPSVEVTDSQEILPLKLTQVSYFHLCPFLVLIVHKMREIPLSFLSS